jgi:hypothetical protein
VSRVRHQDLERRLRPPWSAAFVVREAAFAEKNTRPDADHSFHVPARSGRKDAEVRAKLLDALAAWIETVA